MKVLVSLWNSVCQGEKGSALLTVGIVGMAKEIQATAFKWELANEMELAVENDMEFCFSEHLQSVPPHSSLHSTIQCVLLHWWEKLETTLNE